MNQKQHTDRRNRLRRASFIIAHYEVKEGAFRDIIKNISAGGLAIRTKRTIAAGQAITLTFPLLDFNQPVKVTGKVVRSEPGGFAVQFDTPIKAIVKKSSLEAIVHELDRNQ